MSSNGSWCTNCWHLASRHLWNWREGGTLEDGPYECAVAKCKCSQPQHMETVPMTTNQYREAEAGFDVHRFDLAS